MTAHAPAVPGYRGSRLQTVGLCLLALGVCFGMFLVQGRIGIDLNDEGFIWYGTQRAADGEVPMRDYQAYDPGRYYWGALWFGATGDDGLVTLRAAFAGFQALGLALGLLCLRRAMRQAWALVLGALVLAIWMTPSYKAFEMTLALGAVFFGTRLLEQPTLSRHFAAGVYSGVATFFGRNFGGYSAVALLALIALVQWRVERGPLLKRLGSFGAGIFVGSLPMLVLIALSPGFLDGFVEMNLRLLRHGATNRPRPVPWPWRPQYDSYLVMSPQRAARHFLLGSFFVLIPLFPVTAAVAMARVREWRSRSLLIASAAVGATCGHYAFARADPGHLASAVHPLLLGLMAVPSARSSWNRPAVLAPALVGLLTVSALSAGTEHPLSVRGGGIGWVDRDIAGERMSIRRSDAALIRVLQGLELPLGVRAPILSAPVYPGVYPVLGVKSPVWTLIFTLPEPVERQRALVRSLEDSYVEWAFLCDRKLDWSDDLRLSRTYELLWEHVVGGWEPRPISDPRIPGDCQIRRRP